MLVSLKIPPGIYRQGTEYQSQGRYYDCDLVRWFEGTLRPVGGWRNIIGGAPRANLQVQGKARGFHSWRANSAERFAAIGTHTKLYAYGSSITGVQDITPSGLASGFADNNVNTGFGGGAYGYDTYGTIRTGVNITDFATTWSFDNYGEVLVAVNSQDGRLFYWNLITSTAVPVVATSGTTPVNNKGVIVTDERFVFLLQAGGNRRLVQWSNQEDLFNWQITATTQAGDFELATPGEIMTALKVRGQTLILTSTDAHVANYIGPPLVYGFERVGDGCGCVSRNAAVVGDKLAFWMNDNGFFMYDGFVKNLPCEVSDYVFARINRGQLAKVWAVHSNDYGEITWFYPSGNEVDSYVTYSYRENHWTIGTMARTIGIDNNVFPIPIRIDASGFLFEHEVAYGYDATIPYAQTGPVEIDGGTVVYMSKYLYPDEKTQGQVQANFATRFYPNDQEYPFGPYSLSNPTPIRFTGRQVAAQVEAVGTGLDMLVDEAGDFFVDTTGDTLVVSGFVGQDFRVGNFRMDVEPGGLR